MPLIGTRGAASSRGFGLLSVANIGGPYWIGRLDDAVFSRVAVDSDGNLYMAITRNATTIPVVIVKYNPFGVLQWQQSWSDGVFNHEVRYIGVDKNRNIYVIATIPAVYEALILKLDSSGNILLNKRLDSSYNFDPQGGYLNETTGDLYVVGGGAGSGLLNKYNSSLVGQFTRALSDVNVVTYAVTIDGSGNIFVGSFNNGSFNICKYNSSATLLWQKEIYSATSGPLAVRGLTADSSGNVYATGYFYNGSLYAALTAKLDTSGNLLWQTRLLGFFDGSNLSTALDSNGNLYTAGYSNTNNSQLAKYDSNGNLQWQREIVISGVQNYALDLKIDRSNNLYVGMTNKFFAKLPPDGSLTGTYSVGGVSVTYQASTLTANFTGLSFRTSTITSSSISDSTNNLAGTVTAGTLTSSVTTL